MVAAGSVKFGASVPTASGVGAGGGAAGCCAATVPANSPNPKTAAAGLKIRFIQFPPRDRPSWLPGSLAPWLPGSLAPFIHHPPDLPFSVRPNIQRPVGAHGQTGRANRDRIARGRGEGLVGPHRFPVLERGKN